MIVNKTDHKVVLLARDASGETSYVELERSDTPCYVRKRDSLQKYAIDIDDDLSVDLADVVWQDIVNPLPDEQYGTWYVLSTIAARHPINRKRRDVLIPAKLVKDAQTGKIIACDALQRSPFAELSKYDF